MINQRRVWEKNKMCFEHKAKPKENKCKGHKSNKVLTKSTIAVIKCNIVETWLQNYTESALQL